MSNPECSIGHNRLAQTAPEFTIWCGLENESKHKAHGKRAFGIMMLSNSSVSKQTKLKASRHSNLKSHARYQSINDKNIEKKYKAMNCLLLNDSSNHAADANHFKQTTPTPELKHHHQTLSILPNDYFSPQPPNQVVVNIG